MKEEVNEQVIDVVEHKETIESLTEKIHKLEEHLKIKCTKCDGTGRPRTKTGEPSKTKTNTKCKECGGMGLTGYKIDHIEGNAVKMKRNISRVDALIKSHINKKVVEIMVLEEDGKWGDYSGTFSLSSDEEEEITIAKAEKHFETYFQNGFYHQDKNFAIFILSPIGGKRLIKELSTEKPNNMEVI